MAKKKEYKRPELKVHENLTVLTAQTISQGELN